MSGAGALPPLALLAGGLAMRLRPITETVPKAMLEVAGEPFIAHQLRLLRREGIRDVVLCTGFLSERIEAFVRDGAAFGLQVRYSRDGPVPLGTGGAIKQALPLLSDPFFVMYGDSYLDTRFRPPYEALLSSQKPALMVVYRNEGRWDTSNVDFADGTVRRYDKRRHGPEMRYIDYGLALLRPAAFDRLASVDHFDLADLYYDLAAHGELAGYEVGERFYEIGSPDGLKETDAFLRRGAEAQRL
jgi:NDP-sugar pyrophosphorylase family protein